MPVATSSVFAKQVAARGGGGGPPAKVVVTKSLSAPPSAAPKQCRGSAVQQRGKAKCVGTPDTSRPSTGHEDGGVVTCANRGLLRQMLQVAANDADDDILSDADDDDHCDGSERCRDDLVGSQRMLVGPQIPNSAARHIPTLAAPANWSGAAARPKILSAATSRTDPLTLRPGSPPAIVAALTAAVSISAQRPAPAPAGSIATGPPTHAPAFAAAPRPGSRGGALPAQSIIAVRPAAVVRSGPGTPGVSSATRGVSTINSYAGLHKARPLATSPTGNSMPASRPRCGPQAFDMLRSVSDGRLGSDGGGMGSTPNHATRVAEEDDDDDGFVMPESARGSENNHESANEGSVAMLVVGPTRGLVRGADTTMHPSSGCSGPTSDPLVAVGVRADDKEGSGGGRSGDTGRDRRETAAEYVERLLRGGSVGDSTVAIAHAGGIAEPKVSTMQQFNGTPTQPSIGLVDINAREAPGGSSGPCARTRSQDTRPRGDGPRAVSGAGRDVLVPASGGGPRARSSDARAAVAAARRTPPWPGDQEAESSDDDPSAPRVQWKADLRPMAQEIARNGRPRDDVVATEKSLGSGQTRTGSGGGLAPSRRPPVIGRRPSDESKQGEELVYSRKPREVEFIPATLESYKQKFGEKDAKLGSLGPDLDDEGLLRKRAIKEKVKEFSKELSRINANRQLGAPQRMEPKSEPKPNARAKALEFAKSSVPKPRPAPKPVVLVDGSPTSLADVASPARPTAAAAAREAECAELDKLREFEQRHLEDKAKVERIKEFLGQFAV